jgi:hypothetical protein
LNASFPLLHLIGQGILLDFCKYMFHKHIYTGKIQCSYLDNWGLKM